RAPKKKRKKKEKKAGSAQRTYRWRQWPQRDFEETPSRFATAALEVAPCISKPSIGRLRTRSIKSSPWIRDAPHRAFSLLIRWIRSRRPRSIFGRPTLFRDFQRQNALKPARRHRRMVSG